MKIWKMCSLSNGFRKKVLVVAMGLSFVSAERVVAEEVAADATAASYPQAMESQASRDNTLSKLIRQLVLNGSLNEQEAEALLYEVQNELQMAEANKFAQPQDGDVRVPYIPETVREEIREELKKEVMQQAREERWAVPDGVPEWVSRIQVHGDVRVRNEFRMFSSDNSNQFVDWTRINEGSGYDMNTLSLQLPPMVNSREDVNNSLRIRARLGVQADLGEKTRVGIRLASGNDSPVSATQELGAGLAKKSIWLDQAWVAWTPFSSMKVVGGRFGNPYWTTDMLFSNDLNFDGLAIQYSGRLGEHLSLFVNAGATPFEYSSSNFPSTSLDKKASQGRWLNGVQIGSEWKVGETSSLRGALSIHDFQSIEGQYSSSCELYRNVGYCDTDWSRPAFMQKGNTLMLLRNIALDPTDPASTSLPQYVGIASDFQLLGINLAWSQKAFGNYGLKLEGHYIRNIEYDESLMWARSRGGLVNNLSAAASGGVTVDHIESGDTAYMLQASLGVLEPKKAGDWNAWLGYKYIEPDALPDGFNDSTFHLGGTNAKGFYLGATYQLVQDASLSARWFSAKEVYGAPFAIDVFQLEVNAKF